jgi:hypothetical protein
LTRQQGVAIMAFDCQNYDNGDRPIPWIFKGIRDSDRDPDCSGLVSVLRVEGVA